MIAGKGMAAHPSRCNFGRLFILIRININLFLLVPLQRTWLESNARSVYSRCTQWEWILFEELGRNWNWSWGYFSIEHPVKLSFFARSELFLSSWSYRITKRLFRDISFISFIIPEDFSFLFLTKRVDFSLTKKFPGWWRIDGESYDLD